MNWQLILKAFVAAGCIIAFLGYSVSMMINAQAEKSKADTARMQSRQSYNNKSLEEMERLMDEQRKAYEREIFVLKTQLHNAEKRAEQLAKGAGA